MGKKKKEICYDPALAEQLKDYYKSHDFTGHIVGYDASDSTPEKDKFYAKAKKFCALSWIDQLSALGLNDSSRNYSGNYPLKVLSDANGNYIAKQVAEIMSDRQQFDSSLDVFFQNVQPVLEAGFTSLANSLKKPTEELTEEEIMQVVDVTAQLYMEEMIKALAVAQQAPEIAGLTLKNGTHTDFNESVSENHDKIDFIRKWEHTRTGVGTILSLDRMLEETPESECEMHEVFGEENTDADNALLEEFMKTLNSEESELTKLLLAETKQTDIASALGISQSTVSKRRAKLREKLIEFLQK